MVKSRSRPVPGAGNSDARVMMVGLAPGKDGADLTGIPFTRDPSGELINELIASVGLSRGEDVFITNLVKCNPKDEKGRNRSPSKKEIANCCKYLKREIDCIKPKIIIAFGKDATEFLVAQKVTQMLKVHGRMESKNGLLIFPFMHPAYVIRGAYDRKKYVEDFKLVGSAFRKLTEEESNLSRLDVLLAIIQKSFSDGFQGVVGGKTRLQKLVFLVENELKKQGYKPKYSFRPYLHGPYSRELYTDIEWLRMQKMLDVKTSFHDNSGFMTDFIITETGKKRLKNIENLQTLNFVNTATDIILQKYGEMGIGELVETVHKEFEDYHNPNPNEKKRPKINLDKFMQ
jgi:uracil-DNA glycosylase family 4